MTKAVICLGIAIAVFAGASSAEGGQVQALGSVQVRIVGPESIFVLRPESASSTQQRAQKHNSMRRRVSRRKVRLDRDGHITEGAENVELITINVE